MSFTVGQLREALADTPDNAAVMLIHDGTMRHGGGIAVAPNGTLAVIHCHETQRKSKHFSVTEDGLLGGLSAMGMSVDSIAELLQRSADSVKRRKKSIGLS